MKDDDRAILRRRVTTRLFAEVEAGTDQLEVLRNHDLFSESVVDDEGVPVRPYGTIDEHVSEATDDQLVRAFEQLYHPVEPWAETPEPWQPGQLRLFGSHSNLDKELVGDVRRLLDPLGIDLFIAHVRINPTAEWLAVIEQALNTCHALSAFITQNFHGSLWADQEVGVAYAKGVPILPHRLDADPYGFMGKFQGLRMRTAPEIADEIFQVLSGHDASWRTLAHSMLVRFEESRSYEEAKNRAATIRRLSRFPAELADSLRYAQYGNDQLDGRQQRAAIHELLRRATAI